MKDMMGKVWGACRRLSAMLPVALAAMAATAQTQALMPMPNKVNVRAGEAPFALGRNLDVQGNEESKDIFSRIVESRVGTPQPVTGDATVLLTVDSRIENPEGYRLHVSADTVSIVGGSEAGLFYGLMTFDQILMGDAVRSAAGQVVALDIEDAPRYAFRALMIDPARHFLPVEDVKFFIDRMARYKYNVLQMHLTDDQGWRIDIKSHPELTAKGAFRNPKGSPEGPDNGFYTAQQIKELVEYAARRHVEIIPELDIPGHTAALLAAYPHLGCTPADTIDKVLGETVNLMVCAANPEVYLLYDDIIAEVADMFPSKSIHLGGDEAVLDRNWAKCDHCRDLMDRLGYDDPAQIFNYFFGNILSSVRKHGKEGILWCELDNIRMPANEYLFDYPDDVTLVTWRYGLTPKCIELTRQHGHNLIMAPGEYAYLDYPQYRNDLPEWNNWGMPTTTLEQCYRFDPGYGLDEADREHISGVMGTLWGEAMRDVNRVTYMAYPRALALAEAAWTQPENRSWESFRERMWPVVSDMMRSGVSVRAPYEVGQRRPVVSAE